MASVEPQACTRTALRQTHALLVVGPVVGLTDAQLLDRFLAGDGDAAEAAFAALVSRHGSMVLGVCRRMLSDRHAADDAFQATFLVLARKAHTVRVDDSLGRWLYGVARRIATRARSDLARRLARESPGLDTFAEPAKLAEQGLPDVLGLIDEELGRLPERFRAPIVLCCLEDLGYEEAALRLDWPLGTLKSRLSRARDLLRSRLARRGIAVSATLAALDLAADSSRAAVPAPMTRAVVDSALALKAGGSVAVAAVPFIRQAGRVVASHPRLAVASVLMVCSLAAVGAGVIAGRRSEAAPPLPPPPLADTDRLTPTSRGESGAIAHAVPIKGIEIDGRLDDWPAEIERLPIRNLRNYSGYSLNGLDKVDMDDNSNLMASFMTGYNEAEGVVYLAVIVKDDEHVVAFKDHLHTDAVEIFIEGLRGSRKFPDLKSYWNHEYQDARIMPVLQYVGIAGEGGVYGMARGSFALMYGDTARTKTRMAYRHEGNFTFYEWAVQPFDSYPDIPTVLRPGLRLGLDVTVVDRDAKNVPPAWICWGPLPSVFKGFDARSLGELILEDPHAGSRPVAGSNR
jgi:RNA polymerase sigma factor (sigma-70 family)